MKLKSLKLAYALVDACINLGIKIIAGSCVAFAIAGIFYLLGYPLYVYMGWVEPEPLKAYASAWFWLCVIYFVFVNKGDKQ